jgi:hypothetical protein
MCVLYVAVLTVEYPAHLIWYILFSFLLFGISVALHCLQELRTISYGQIGTEGKRKMKKIIFSLSLMWLVLGLVGFFLAEAYSLAGINNNGLGMYQSPNQAPKIRSTNLQRAIKPFVSSESGEAKNQIPEAATMLLFGTGLVGISVIGRKMLVKSEGQVL